MRAANLNPEILKQVQIANLAQLQKQQEQPGVYPCSYCGHATLSGPLPCGPPVCSPVCMVCLDICASIMRVRPFMLDHIAWVVAGKPEIHYHE